VEYLEIICEREYEFIVIRSIENDEDDRVLPEFVENPIERPAGFSKIPETWEEGNGL
jgi:hypothetical protein